MSNFKSNEIPRKIQLLSRREFLKYSGALALTTILTPQFPETGFDASGTNGIPLRTLAQKIIGPFGKPFKIGIYLSPDDMNDPTGLPEQLAAQQFNHRVNKGTQIRQNYAPNKWSFTSADALLQKASLAGQSMIGELIWSWDGSIPDWIKNGGYNRDQLIAIIQAHIGTMLTRYKGKISAYQVVNEAHRPGPTNTPDWWESHIGSDYVQIAFQAARQADPTAVLIYNHYSNETKYYWNYNITKNDIDILKSQGLVDAVGVQLHLWTGRPAKADVVDALKSYGLPVWITEFDSVQLSGVSNPDQEQADITASMMQAIFESGVCDHFTNWGLTDKYDGWDYGAGTTATKCELWDVNFNAKPNYYAMQQVMSANVTLVNDVFLPMIAK